MISICTTCMGRLFQLRQTLPANLEITSGMDVEFVVLDYSSEDGLSEWIKTIFDSRVRYIRINGEKEFHRSKAKNLAVMQASKPIVLCLDADNLLTDLTVPFILEAFNSGVDVVAAPALVNEQGTFGRLAMTKRLFQYVGGYDETFTGYGYEDTDLRERLARLKLTFKMLPMDSLKVVGGDEDTAIKCQNHSEPVAETMRTNERRMWSNIRSGKIRVKTDMSEKPDIIFRAMFNDEHGTGIMATKQANGLKQLGYRVSHQSTRSGLLSPPAVGNVFVMETADLGFLEASLIPGCVASTIWESSRFKQEVVDALNQKASRVIVPCKWNHMALVTQGLTRPIHVVPNGIDTQIFKPISVTKSAVVFAWAGRTVHGTNRKNLEATIQAFTSAFSQGEDVRLHIKVLPDDPVRVPDDPRIRVNNSKMSPEDLATWYNSATAFVSTSRGEGWGLHLHEAMACGVCPIACEFGGQAEFFNESVGYSIPYSLINPADEPYVGLGTWCDPDVDYVIDAMRDVYNNEVQVKRFGEKATAAASKFTWQNAVNKLDEVLWSAFR